MSLVVSKSNPDIRLQKAIRDFEKDLSREQRVGFEAQRAHASRSLPTYQDVLRLTEKIDWASRALKRGRCFRPRFKKCLGCRPAVPCCRGCHSRALSEHDSVRCMGSLANDFSRLGQILLMR